MRLLEDLTPVPSAAFARHWRDWRAEKGMTREGIRESRRPRRHGTFHPREGAARRVEGRSGEGCPGLLWCSNDQHPLVKPFRLTPEQSALYSPARLSVNAIEGATMVADTAALRKDALVPLASLEDIVFGAWDIFDDNAFDAAMKAGVLEKDLLNQVSEQLASLKPMPAVFEQNYVKRLHGENVKVGKNKMELAEQLIEDIARFKTENGCDRLVICGLRVRLRAHPPDPRHQRPNIRRIRSVSGIRGPLGVRFPDAKASSAL